MVCSLSVKRDTGNQPRLSIRGNQKKWMRAGKRKCSRHMIQHGLMQSLWTNWDHLRCHLKPLFHWNTQDTALVPWCKSPETSTTWSMLCVVSPGVLQVGAIKRYKEKNYLHIYKRAGRLKNTPGRLLACLPRLIRRLLPFPTSLWNSDSVESRNQFALIEGLNLSKRDFLGQWNKIARGMITLQICCCSGRNTIFKKKEKKNP